MDCQFKVGDVVDYNELATDLVKSEIGPGPFVLTRVRADRALGSQVSLRGPSGNVCNRLGGKSRYVSAAYFQKQS
jgi:hypothetical protein